MEEKAKAGYFHRVTEQTPTRLWVNNATPQEATAAIAAGAINVSTNPTYPSKLPAAYLNSLIDQALETSDDDNQVAEIVYRQAVRRLQEMFLPLYKQSQGQMGYVAIQGDPRINPDEQAVLDGALEYYEQMGENLIVKVPSTPAGAFAMEKLVSMGLPSIGTLGFSVDQA